MTVQPFLKSRPTLATLVLATALATFATPSHALNILLVNDDGCTAPGINILADALQAAGHSIQIYAPASDQSGQGSRITVPSAGCQNIHFGVSRNDLNNTATPAPNRQCVTASIATCSAPLPHPFTASNQSVGASPYESALTGLEMMRSANAPDLVISGINRGENVGATTNNSGTVNAALAAIHQGYPAIAVSLGIPAADNHYPATANFIVRLIDRLQKEAHGSPLLPAKTGLNINYPGNGAPKGVLLTQIGTFSTAVTGPRLQSDGSLKFGFTIDMKPHGTPVAEITEEGIALREGYISISTLDGTLGTNQSELNVVKSRLKDFKP